MVEATTEGVQKMAKKLTLLVGPPGSGKSTEAKRYLDTHGNRKDLVRISQDDQGKQGHMDEFNKALRDGKDIVVDRMNFDKKQRRRYLDPARKFGYKTRIVVLHVPMDTCLERCLERKDHPTVTNALDAHSAVKTFFSKYERVTDDEADEVFRAGWVSSNEIKAVVCDLDGTMADVEHRRKFVRPDDMPEGKKFRPNWEKFFEEMVNDPVNEWCREAVSLMSERYPIVYATGRPGDYRSHTEMWLEEKGLKFPGCKLFTRLEGDCRKDSIVKEIILEFEIKTRYNILFVLDDRKQVVDMWRSHGYTVLQCDEGNF